MRFLALILLVYSIFTYANTDFGLWGTACSNDGFFIKVSEESSPLVINDNQIVISIHAKENPDGVIHFFYDKTLDLGAGGMNLDWDNVSLQSDVAEMKINGDAGVFKWNGFFNDRSKKYFWVNEPDFVQGYAEHNVIKLHRCK
ncbi:hypothetical protein [Enterobacter cloacae]|uniref:hypothetical protein n=1 Tax=Enterobacter cloacae TaxID=550 RepID=UPI00300D03D1